jgi:hypothetical protein
MKAKYFKITRPENSWWTPNYIKIVGDNKDSSELNIFDNSIDISHKTGDDFDERVCLLYDRKMPKEKIIEVKRDEFDMFYKRIVERLNKLSVI